jgi:hypothetical protein
MTDPELRQALAAIYRSCTLYCDQCRHPEWSISRSPTGSHTPGLGVAASMFIAPQQHQLLVMAPESPSVILSLECLLYLPGDRQRSGRRRIRPARSLLVDLGMGRWMVRGPRAGPLVPQHASAKQTHGTVSALSLVLCNSVPSSLVFVLGNTTAARARKGENR